MIRLTFYDTADKSYASFYLPDVRVTGGVIWSHLGRRLLANYADGSWKHGGQYYPSLSVTGECYLLFGIARDPSFVSEPIQWLSITGTALRANGTAFAQYNARQDIWQGLRRPIWWTTMRMIGPTAFSAFVGESRIERLNPWDPLPSRAA
jgi:hypothetical protein